MVQFIKRTSEQGILTNQLVKISSLTELHKHSSIFNLASVKATGTVFLDIQSVTSDQEDTLLAYIFSNMNNVILRLPDNLLVANIPLTSVNLASKEEREKALVRATTLIDWVERGIVLCQNIAASVVTQGN